MPMRFSPTGERHRVTTLELLFDLVFVYAITAVSESLAHRLTLTGVADSWVIMALIWFGWSAYAWLGNQARADEGPLRLSMYLAMAGYFVVALTIREAFHDLPGGLPGPVVFVAAYAVIRLAHLVLYWLAAAGDAELRRTVRRTLSTTAPALVILLVGALVPADLRLPIWVVAVLVDYAGIFLGGSRGWRVTAPGHFAERHGLVVIIAIGESVVSVAVAVSGGALDWTLLAGALLGITLAISLWRTYFAALADHLDQRLTQLQGDARTRLARDCFTYLHLPAVVGIVGVAVGLRVMLHAVAEPEPAAHVPGLAVMALCGGAALYLLTLAGLRWRIAGRPDLPRSLVAVWLLVAGASMARLQPAALVPVVVVVASFLALAALEARGHREAR